MDHGLIFNIQKYSIHDGPGVRTTVFLKGCPLRCWWCHNPESQSGEPGVRFSENRCIRCGQCVDVCPQGSSEVGQPGQPVVNMEPVSTPEGVCICCGACVEACPTEARQMVGRTVSVAELMAEIRKDRIFYDDSGGGVTFSGGEPLMQPVFLLAALEACRSEGIHTAVDTCGFAHPGDLLSVAQQTDLFLYDLKIVNDRLHQQWTGISNSVILDNLRALGRIEANIWIRVPIFPGYNDEHSDLVAAARFAAMVPGVQQVNLLPYHRLGRHKGNGQDSNQRRHEVPTPEPGHLEKIADLFRSFGHVTRIGG